MKFPGWLLLTRAWDALPGSPLARTPYTRRRSAGFQACCIADFQVGRASKRWVRPQVWKPATQQAWRPALHGSGLLSSAARTVALCLSLISSTDLLFGDPAIDESKLPPPATNHIDFKRDIKPIFDASCLRCHGPERPKSRFRLDNREAALKGGENGVDILPGNSAKSPLIHYVARLVEDLEMPPPGKGEPLTTNQIALLRAWIDQGAVWNAPPPTNSFSRTVSPIFGGTSVSGDKHKFREHYGQREGLNGGVEQFELIDRTDPQTTLSFSGHALQDDFKLILGLNRNEVGFVHAGIEQYRKYFDDTGGYFPPFVQPAPSLGRDLHLDLGKAWIDFGLALPHWPRMVLGYEYDYKRGDEATTTWNLTSNGAASANPSSKNIQEGVHIIKFDVDAEFRGVTIEERFRGQFYNLNTYRTNSDARNASAEQVRDANHYFQAANTIRLEKQVKDWLFTSGGYLFSKLDADASFTDSINNFGVPSLAHVPNISLDRESHVLNLNSLFGPFSGVTFSTGVQGEWTRQHGFGSGNLNQINTTGPITSLPIIFSTLVSDYDQSSALENVAVRYTKIPFTILFAEARLQQQSISQSDADIQSTGNFQENPSLSSQLSDLRFGFHTSPWRRISASAHYRRYEDDSHTHDNQIPQPIGGYPGFIQSRNLVTDEAEAKVALQLCSWFKTTLSYQFLTTGYRTGTRPALDANSLATLTPGGNQLSGREDAQVYSISGALAPTARLYLLTTFSYRPTATRTINNESPFLTHYVGDIYSVLASGTYVLNNLTDLYANYSFSDANYGHSTSPLALPLGIVYQQHALRAGLARRFGKYVTSKLQYGYYYYREPSSGGANNYTAHAVFGTITLRLP